MKNKLVMMVLSIMMVLTACTNKNNSEVQNTEYQNTLESVTEIQTSETEESAVVEIETEKTKMEIEDDTEIETDVTEQETESEVINSSDNGANNNSSTENTTTNTGGGFIEKYYYFFSTEEMKFYDSPSTSGNLIYVMEEYSEIGFDAYNADTGWYRGTLGLSGEQYTVYVYKQDFLTVEQYRALLNEGISEEYYSLPCVSEAEHYCTLKNISDIGFSMATLENRNTGKACVHINGKHNFVSPELCRRCGERRFEAECEWKDMYLFYAIDNHDGTVYLNHSQSLASTKVTIEEYYAEYTDHYLFDSWEACKKSQDDYVKAEVLKVLYGE